MLKDEQTAEGSDSILTKVGKDESDGHACANGGYAPNDTYAGLQWFHYGYGKGPLNYRSSASKVIAWGFQLSQNVYRLLLSLLLSFVS
jgi:hypothetical protein